MKSKPLEDKRLVMKSREINLHESALIDKGYRNPFGGCNIIFDQQQTSQV